VQVRGDAGVAAALGHFPQDLQLAGGEVAQRRGAQPGVSAMAVGATVASTVWLLAIGIRGAKLSDPRRAGVARIGRLIAVVMLCSAALSLFGFAINVAAIVWAALIAGGLAWLVIPVWVMVMGRALRSRAGWPISEATVNTAAWTNRR
jgi:hypothetical protein